MYTCCCQCFSDQAGLLKLDRAAKMDHRVHKIWTA
jgi:hypothetical protein